MMKRVCNICNKVIEEGEPYHSVKDLYIDRNGIPYQPDELDICTSCHTKIENLAAKIKEEVTNE